jgi:acyl-CoA synthetase (AMP-forming)/AMP-acid ligase II
MRENLESRNTKMGVSLDVEWEGGPDEIIWEMKGAGRTDLLTCERNALKILHCTMWKRLGHLLQPTVLFVVPSLLLFLASHPAVTKEHLSSIEKVLCGAAPATKNLIDKFKAKLDRDIYIRQGQ